MPDDLLILGRDLIRSDPTDHHHNRHTSSRDDVHTMVSRLVSFDRVVVVLFLSKLVVF